MRKASTSPERQAEYSWRGGHQRYNQSGQMQERSALRRLLNATIVVCGASYILYVAVYLGLDLKSIIARPLHEPASIKLRLHTNPAQEVGQDLLQLHSAGHKGTQDAYADADGINRVSDLGRPLEEPVPGLGMLADGTRSEMAGSRLDEGKASAESSLFDVSDNIAAAGQPVKAKMSSMSDDELSATDPWLEDRGSEDRRKPEGSSSDSTEDLDSLLEMAEEKDSAKGNSLLQGLGESSLDRTDDKLSTIGNNQPAAVSAEAKKAASQALEPEGDLFVLDSGLAADRETGGSLDDAAKPTTSETARAVELSADDELTAGDEDSRSPKPDDDPFMTASGSRGSSSAQTLKEEGGSLGMQSASHSKADTADWEIQEEPYTISRLDEEDDDWEDDALLSSDELLEEDALLEDSSAGEALDR